MKGFGSSKDKGKQRGNGGGGGGDEEEQRPLLSDSASTSTNFQQPQPASAGNTPTRARNLVRHGRGPLLNDSDDEGNDSSLSQTRLDRRHSYSPGRSFVCSFFLSFFFICLLLVAILHLWLGRIISEQAKSGSLEQMARRGVLFTGPSSFSIEDGHGESDVVLKITGDAGIDVRAALDWRNKDQGDWIRRAEGRLARWGVRKVKTVEATLGRVAVMPRWGGSELVVVDGMSPILLALSYPRLEEDARMDPVTLELPISFPSPAELATFLRQVWELKKAEVQLVLQDIKVNAGTVEGFMGRFVNKFGRVSVPRVKNRLTAALPDLPGTSDPSSLVELEDYSITPSTNSSSISMEASARLTNPLRLHSSFLNDLPTFIRNLTWGMPFDLPIDIYLPPTQETPLPPSSLFTIAGENGNGKVEPNILMAKVVTHPFEFTHGAKHAWLSLNGRLEPIGNLSSVSAPSTYPRRQSLPETKDDKAKIKVSEALSQLVSRYLGGKNSTIIAKYGSPDSFPAFFLSSLPSFSNTTAHYPPPIVGDVVRDLEIPLILPGSNSGKTEFFKNLQIEDMKIRLSSFLHYTSSSGGDDDDDDEPDDPEGDLLCSGRVVGELVMPDHFDKLGGVIDVNEIWPDVYVYDGALPKKSLEGLERRNVDSQLAFASDSPVTTFSSSYPPVPIPAAAFARLRPSSYIAAVTEHIPANSTHNATTMISATFVDAPLFLLPGRGDVFRRFVGKILFGGANAKVLVGVRGVTGVEIGMHGWGEVGLSDLPIEGEFNIGKGGVEAQ